MLTTRFPTLTERHETIDTMRRRAISVGTRTAHDVSSCTHQSRFCMRTQLTIIRRHQAERCCAVRDDSRRYRERRQLRTKSLRRHVQRGSSIAATSACEGSCSKLTRSPPRVATEQSDDVRVPPSPTRTTPISPHLDRAVERVAVQKRRQDCALLRAQRRVTKAQIAAPVASARTSTVPMRPTQSIAAKCRLR